MRLVDEQVRGRVCNDTDATTFHNTGDSAWTTVSHTYMNSIIYPLRQQVADEIYLCKRS